MGLMKTTITVTPEAELPVKTLLAQLANHFDRMSQNATSSSLWVKTQNEARFEEGRSVAFKTASEFIRSIGVENN